MAYQRHKPEDTALHKLVRENLWGFRRRQCEGCGHEEICCFSSKTRQLCPSCSARQMAEGAIHLVESVLPVAPVRQ